MKIDTSSAQEEEINLAPLIDCVFLLLIFFMVSTTMQPRPEKLDTVKELEVAVPQSLSPDLPSPAAEAFVVVVDARGQTYRQSGELLSTTDLHRVLKDLARKSPDRPISIAGDANAPHRSIAHLVDLCHFVGIRQVSLRVQDKK